MSRTNKSRAEARMWCLVYVNASCLTNEGIGAHEPEMWRDSFMCIRDVTHLCVCVTWLIHVYVWHDSLMFMCDMTRSCVCVTWLMHVWMSHVSFSHETWLIHMCDVAPLDTHEPKMPQIHWYVWHDSFLYQTWLIHMCDIAVIGAHELEMPDHYVFIHETRLIRRCSRTRNTADSLICMTRSIHKWDTTRLYMIHDSFVGAHEPEVLQVHWNIWSDLFSNETRLIYM